jgi:AcrR family transcriptional regulator
MRRTKEDANLTRLALLDASLDIFSHQGYEASRLEDIAERANVTRGAIYHHFGGKAELFHALIEEASAAGSQVINQAIGEGGNFLDITRRVLVYTLNLLKTNTQFRGVMSLYLLKSSNSPELKDFLDQRKQQMNSQLEQITAFFKMGQSQGFVRLDVDALIASKAFLAFQNGLILMWLSNPETISIEEDALALADVLILGLAARNPLPE